MTSRCRTDGRAVNVAAGEGGLGKGEPIPVVPYLSYTIPKCPKCRVTALIRTTPCAYSDRYTETRYYNSVVTRYVYGTLYK